MCVCSSKLDLLSDDSLWESWAERSLSDWMLEFQELILKHKNIFFLKDSSMYCTLEGAVVPLINIHKRINWDKSDNSLAAGIKPIYFF